MQQSLIHPSKVAIKCYESWSYIISLGLVPHHDFILSNKETCLNTTTTDNISYGRLSYTSTQGSPDAFTKISQTILVLIIYTDIITALANIILMSDVL